MELKTPQLSNYIHTTYGECKLEKCLCIKEDDNHRLLCSNWIAATANAWDELLEQAIRKRNGK